MPTPLSFFENMAVVSEILCSFRFKSHAAEGFPMFSFKL